ncbi:MAG: elongation factor G [Omnitrophica WOR_2 bacterium]
MNKVETPVENIRVIGIFAHIDAGKTTTSEAILYRTGRIHRPGSVDEGSTQLDWMEQERARGITITAAATTCYWQGCRINLIDTPGHIDFTAEVMRSMHVIDGAVIVLCGVGGVETQTETVWRYADQNKLPRLVFINKLDLQYADFDRALAVVRQKLAPGAAALQIPIGSGNSFTGVVDLLEQRALVWKDGSEDPHPEPIPARLVEQAKAAREALLDAICETDENLLSQRLDGHAPGNEALRAGLRRATIAGKLIPVLCGSARRRIGIEPLLDAVAGFLPSPAVRLEVNGMVPGDEEDCSRLPPSRLASTDDPFCASVFKIIADVHAGHLVWARVFSGKLDVGGFVYNPRAGERERVGRIYQIHANRQEHTGTMQAGDVVALVGLKSVVTGDTLCDPENPIQLESIRFPEPVISVALAPSCEEERDRLHQCVARLCEGDPTLRLSFDPDTGEQILSGMGELHLEIAIDRLRSEYGLIATASPFQIAYRETVLRKAEATGTYRKQTGGHGHYAVARLRVEPADPAEGVLFRNIAPALEVPFGFVRAIEAGAREALAKGVIAGFPFAGVSITLLGGRYHEIDSNSLDFRIAGSQAVRQAVLQAKPGLLEPVMHAGIRLDERYLGTLLGDFARRRGAVIDLDVHGSRCKLTGDVPLAEMRGYASDLRGMTQGRGDFTLEFRRYDRVPEKLAEQVVAERVEAGRLIMR